MTFRTLGSDWQALLDRRPTFRPTLAAYEPIVSAWAEWDGEGPVPLAWSAEECRKRWERGLPLLPEASLTLEPGFLEPLLGPALEIVTAVSGDPGPAQRFAGAWDGGVVTPAMLLPAPGRIGDTQVLRQTGLTQEALAFLALAALRPVLEPYFAECRAHLGGGWTQGVCPFCGAPPAFADLMEDGQRRLACHVCGGGWGFGRLQCPYCGTRQSSDLVRLLAEDREEGYALFACKGCRGYVKELDRRVRWDGGPALVEDWGTPHLDLAARREDYWRAVPTLLQLERSASDDA